MSNIANCEDLGMMMASGGRLSPDRILTGFLATFFNKFYFRAAVAVGNPAANGVVFNCVHNKGVTLDGMVRACAAAMGAPCPVREKLSESHFHWDFGHFLR